MLSYETLDAIAVGMPLIPTLLYLSRDNDSHTLKNAR